MRPVKRAQILHIGGYQVETESRRKLLSCGPFTFPSWNIRQYDAAAFHAEVGDKLRGPGGLACESVRGGRREIRQPYARRHQTPRSTKPPFSGIPLPVERYLPSAQE